MTIGFLHPTRDRSEFSGYQMSVGARKCNQRPPKSCRPRARIREDTQPRNQPGEHNAFAVQG
jgi:hypothetical protein